MAAATRAPAYSVTEVEVIDQDGFERYRELAQAAVAQYGGRLLVQGGEPTVAEGDWPSGHRLVIIEFATMEQLRAWYDSPEYGAARSIAKQALRRTLLFVEGTSTPSK